MTSYLSVASVAELRGTNSALKIGGGLRRNRGGVQRGGVQTSCFEGGELLELEKASYFFDGTRTRSLSF